MKQCKNFEPKVQATHGLHSVWTMGALQKACQMDTMAFDAIVSCTPYVPSIPKDYAAGLVDNVTNGC